MAKSYKELENTPMIKCGPGVMEDGTAYDEKYIIEKTVIYVIAPKITREESNRRWQQVCEVATEIAYNMAARGELTEDCIGD